MTPPPIGIQIGCVLLGRVGAPAAGSSVVALTATNPVSGVWTISPIPVDAPGAILAAANEEIMRVALDEFQEANSGPGATTAEPDPQMTYSGLPASVADTELFGVNPGGGFVWGYATTLGTITTSNRCTGNVLASVKATVGGSA